jgi:hypothetical protein
VGAGCSGEVVISPAFKIKTFYGSLEMSYRPGQATRPGPVLLTLQVSPRKTTSNLKGSGLDAEGNRASLTLQYGWF